MKTKKRKFTLRSYSIQLRTGDWVKVKEVLPIKKHGRFRADFLGAYNFHTRKIEILPPRVMYDIVLDHEAGHAASRISWIIHRMLGWEVRSIGPLAIGIGYLYLSFFGVGFSKPEIAYAWGLASSIFLLGVLSSLEEWKNRLGDRVRAQNIVREWKKKP